MADMRTLASVILGPVRAHGRPVAWTPDFMGWGNLLQLAMWAHDGRLSGERRWIRANPNLVPWLDEFPGLRQVVLLPEQVRFTDKRMAPWSENARRRGISGAVPLHTPVDIAAVERFLRDVVLPGSRLAAKSMERDMPEMVVNVRRGDYYSDPDIRAQYGFDVGRYLRVAVNDTVERDGVPSAITVVSDDLDWCERELRWLGELAPTHFAVGQGPIADFATAAGARRLVITNSTFSYWAAHTSNLLHGDNHALVWAPRFFDRTQNGGRSWLLDERWSVVEELGQSWDDRVEGVR